MADDSTTVNVHLLFFAKSRELTGETDAYIDLPSNINTEELLKRIITSYPRLEVLQENLIIAVNQEYVEDKLAPLGLKEHFEIAIIPPLSGMECNDGQNVIKVTHDMLKCEDIYEIIGCPSCGAVSMFIGTTRDHFEGKKVVQLEYEAYIPMAEKEIHNICADIRSRWQVKHIAVFHRLGLVKIGEASVMIGISSTHRKESLESVQYCIDKLKEKVPIWKKEVYEDGGSDWKANKECNWTKKNQQIT